MKASITAHKGGIRLWAVVIWLLVWQGASMMLNQALLLPAPIAVAQRLGELVLTGSFWQSIGISLLRILLGFCLACTVGSGLAALALGFRRLQELLAPLMAMVKAVPVASFIILALVWLSSKQLSVFISFLMALPVIYYNVLDGLGHTDQKLLEMAQVFRIPLMRRITGIYLPQVLPYFQTACSLALGLCWKASIAAEVIGLPKNTIGEQLYYSKIYLEMQDLFAWTVVIVVVSIVLERWFLRMLDWICKKAVGQCK